ncbi:sphingomyelin phosphodiesterase [Marasmius fiardii PR-910]|nr:sphingomyelin phosphodiesterase [Marasmius fiardii PR-910]
MHKASHQGLVQFLLPSAAMRLSTSKLVTLFSWFALARANDLLTVISRMDDCSSCRDLLVQLKDLAVQGDDVFVENFIGLCQALQIAEPIVCDGLITKSGPIIAHDLRQINVTYGKASAGLCDALFGFCSTNTSTPFKVPLPAPHHDRGQKAHSDNQPRKQPFKVVHISDVHIDREYTVGSEANCTKTLCCRIFPDDDGSPISVPAPPNGNSKCDSPVSLADSMLEAVNAINPKFIIFTGDVVDGNFVWLGNQTGVENELKGFNSELSAKVRFPVFPALGNHDSLPVNAFARSTSMTSNNSQFVFDIQSAGWEQWVGNDASEQVKHGSGSYSSLVPGTRLRILSINTQYWYKQNFWLWDSDEFQPDPNGVLAFIAHQLEAAEQAEEKVWVIGHIPIGKEDIVEDQSNYYDQILQRYKHTIAGHFFGHSHKDEFQIAYSDYNNQTAANAISVASVGPALTPTSGNPAFKLYEVDPDTFGLMNVRMIFTNTSEPSFQTHPQWRELYNTRDLYGPLVELSPTSELTPGFWHNLTQVFQTNDTVFQLFNSLLSREGAVVPCDGQCKDTRICDLRAFRSENNCDVPTPGAKFRKRDVDGMITESEACEGFGLGSFFRLLYASLRASPT